MQHRLSTSKLVDGYHKAFIDSSIEADDTYAPQFIANSNGKKVLTVIENELKGCDDLFISVAFITMGGIAPLLGTLKDLEKRGTKGRILTTDYLMFSDPMALDKLNSLSNLDIKVFKTAEQNTGFHTKGYMFHNNTFPAGLRYISVHRSGRYPVCPYDAPDPPAKANGSYRGYPLFVPNEFPYLCSF